MPRPRPRDVEVFCVEGMPEAEGTLCGEAFPMAEALPKAEDMAPRWNAQQALG